MILYFTGAGNTKYLANMLSSQINDECISMNDILKNNKQIDLYSENPWIILAPIHAWRYPKSIETLLKKGIFKGNLNTYFIATMGLQCGNAKKYLRRIIVKKKMIYRGFYGVKMPDTYIPMFNPEPINESKNTIVNANVTINDISRIILNNEELTYREKTMFSSFLSGFVNFIFNKLFINSKKYYTKDSCVKCLKCIFLCPVNNIEMNEKITFKRNCIGCLSCIHNCPVSAIEIKGKTEKRSKYHINDLL